MRWVANSRCLSSQRYNFLKANHNYSFLFANFRIVVYQVKDTIFWKQITTTGLSFVKWLKLFIKSKIQFFESKSQLFGLLLAEVLCCLSSQRYNFLKANHNIPHEQSWNNVVVYQVKDTIFWKQITTANATVIALAALFIKSKIQFFESKSQPKLPASIIAKRCLSSQRYNFLKANHNNFQ